MKLPTKKNIAMINFDKIDTKVLMLKWNGMMIIPNNLILPLC